MILTDLKPPANTKHAYIYLRLVQLYGSIEAVEIWCLKHYKSNINPLPHLRKTLVGKCPIVTSVHYTEYEPLSVISKHRLPKLFIFHNKREDTIKLHLE